MAEAYIKLFFDFPRKVAALTPAQRYELIEAMLQYGKTRQPPTTEKNDPAVCIMFPVFQAQLDQDHEAYMTRIVNGQKGGRPPKKPNETEHNRPVSKKPNETDRPLRMKNEESRMNNEESRMKNEDTPTTTTDSTYTGTPAGGGAGGGDFPPDILAYAREAARGAEHPAAYERKILERIRKAGFKTIEEVRVADEDRRKRPATPTGPVYAEEDDFY